MTGGPQLTPGLSQPTAAWLNLCDYTCGTPTSMSWMKAYICKILDEPANKSTVTEAEMEEQCKKLREDPFGDVASRLGAQKAISIPAISRGSRSSCAAQQALTTSPPLQQPDTKPSDLKMAKTRGNTYGDSQLLVGQIQGVYSSSHPSIRAQYLQARRLAPTMHSTGRHRSREGN
ncbi:hypothetical protein H257_17729 [Aphanomyces astaci]|uniref:Uncharacterized protein n=1 Tax=Aphanomyces astaci TaxID=112090 RepID=W4FDP5_APHAT|nr:hypothetical protein H257_17729 [Aphanomyces astaci]ETV65575.1 hypothetical protein H257_17729 [Aphanomyces astaci]|eukprot:XP_009844917.1 hypothetical protein H257_17729 [Aphanomyces astaci]